jgi:comEA protein
MNKKPSVELLAFVQKVLLSTAFFISISAFVPAQAQQSVVDNPMLSSSPVRYGPYRSSTNRPLQIQSVTSSQTSSTKVKSVSSTQKKSTTGIININTASETELVALPGIGPSKARAIAEYRQSQGSFKSIDDLQKVKGIGPATLDKLRAHVTL